MIKRTAAESNNIGPFIFNTENAELDVLSDGQSDNRQRFVDFCTMNNLIMMNTWFEKPMKRLATYRSPTTPDFSKIPDMSSFAQMDFILIGERWRKAIRNCNAKVGAPFESDH